MPPNEGCLSRASITNDSASQLGLKPGMKTSAVIKASNVMVGVG